MRQGDGDHQGLALVETLRRDFGRELRRLRTDAGISLKKLGSVVRLSTSALSDLELGRGVRPPDRTLVDRYLQACLLELKSERAIKAERNRRLLEDYATLVSVLEKAPDRRAADRATLAADLVSPVPDYHAQIGYLLAFYRRIFAGRAWELTRIAQFVAEKDPGYLLVTGLPGYGKSALVAEVVGRAWDQIATGDPHAVDVIYYFIREGEGYDTVEGFLTAVVPQLIAALCVPEETEADAPALRRQFTRLWQAASARAHRGRALVLIVDGLDESAAESPGIPTLLPANLGDNVHVVVTSRPSPNPLTLVAPEHPLRRAAVLALEPFDIDDIANLFKAAGADEPTPALASRVLQSTGGEPLLARSMVEDVVCSGEHVLSDLERAEPEGAREYFSWQLSRLGSRLAGADRESRRALGILLAAHGPMTHAELADVLVVPLADTRRAIATIERFLIGDRALTLMHYELRMLLKESYFSAAEQASFGKLLRDWCNGFLTKGWPRDTPDYVVAHSASHFAEAGDNAALAALVGPRWKAIRYRRTRSNREFGHDLSLALTTLRASSPYDLAEEIRLAQVQCTLAEASNAVPASTLAAIARVDGTVRVRNYIDSIQSAGERARLCFETAYHLAEASKSNEAGQLAAHGSLQLRTIDNIAERAERCALFAGRMGLALPVEATQLARLARSLANSLPDRLERARTLRQVAIHLSVGTTPESGLAAQDFNAAALRTTDDEFDAELIEAAGEAAFDIGDQRFARDAADRILEAARAIEDTGHRSYTTLRAARLWFALGDLERGLAAIATIPDDTNARSAADFEALRAMAPSMDGVAAIEIAATIPDSTWRSWALLTLAMSAAEAGNTSQALDILLTVEDSHTGAEGMARLASAHFAAGRPDDGLYVADLAFDAAFLLTFRPSIQLTLNRIIDVLTQAGDAGCDLALRRLDSSGLPEDEKAHYRARVLAARGEVAAAAAAAVEIRISEVRDRAIIDVVRAMELPRDSLRALRLTRRIADPGLRARWLGSVAVRLTDDADTSLAATIAEESIAAARVPRITNYQANSYALLSKALSARGETSMAARIAEETVGIARSVSGARSRAEALAFAAAALAEAGMEDAGSGMASEAMNVTSLMWSDPQGRVLAIGEVAAALSSAQGALIVAAGHEAVRTARKMARDDLGKANALAHAAAAVARSGDVELAIHVALEPPQDGRQSAFDGHGRAGAARLRVSRRSACRRDAGPPIARIRRERRAQHRRHLRLRRSVRRQRSLAGRL